METLTNKHGLNIDDSVLDIYPQLVDCVSATEASKVMYGVKTLTAYIHLNYSKVHEIVEFFKGNHSDMVAFFAAVGKDWFSFYPMPTDEHRKAFKLLIKGFGMKAACHFATHHDFQDIVRGYEWVRADKKRVKSLERAISGIDAWPAHTQAVIVHDYIVSAMKRAERPKTARKPRSPRYTFERKPLQLPEMPEGYQLLVPKDSDDLKKIGNAQSHCVGTDGMGYDSRMANGSIHIVALYRKNLQDGVCVEFDRYGNVLQAQGKGRRQPKPSELEIIAKIADKIANNS